MKKTLRIVLDRIHRLLHDYSLVSLPDRPAIANTGSFENYLDYFHNSIHENEEEVKWMGKKARKFPMDAWVYQEIIHETRPEVIVEVGNWNGGSTLFLANMLDLLDRGRVLALDIDHSKIDFNHPRITWITGDANSPQVLSEVVALIGDSKKVLVIEDSSHTFENTLAVLRNYNRFVNVGSYFIVEDGICKYTFVDGPKPGPYEAVQQFLRENSGFEVDKSREKFVLTYNPSGYLRRIREPREAHHSESGIGKT